MELENLKEMDKKEQERVSNIAKKHEGDKKVDVGPPTAHIDRDSHLLCGERFEMRCQ